MNWASAFQKANEIGSLMDHEVPESFLKRKRPIEENDESNGKEKKEEDDDEDDYGAFKQPKKLAKFIVETSKISTINSNTPSNKNTKEENNAELVTKDSQIKETISSTHQDQVQDNQSDEPTDSQEPKGEKFRLTLDERCAKQICRTWLKHHYLETGKACNESICKRMHSLDCFRKNIAKLYSDFSFKGLPKQQQKTILAKFSQEIEENK